jgi:hypothetical protein
MREDFLKNLWTLTRLRYGLIWAQARTSNGKIIALLALYLLGASGALLVAFSGLGAALIDADLDRGGQMARWTLAVLFINGIGLSLMFGVGTQTAFSDESLRRYPMKAKERFFIRQIIGLLDPIWAFIAVGAFALAVGLSVFGKGGILFGLPAAALFIATCYLATICLLSFIGHVMRSRAASTVMGILLLLLVSFGPLALSLLTASGDERVWEAAGRIFRLTPPGAAAAMMAGNRWPVAVGNGALLMGWVLALAWVLNRLERMPPITATEASGGISWNDFYDQIAGLFGRKYAPYVSKSLRYHLRCNLVRFSLMTSPMLVLLGKFLTERRSEGGGVVVTFGLFFIASSAIGVSMMLNLFGYDGAGIRRYVILPAKFVTALRASSLASLSLRAVVMSAAFTLWYTFTRPNFDPRLLLMLLGVAGSGLFLFNGLGLWTSVLSPKISNFDAMWNNRLSLGANIVMLCGVVAPYMIAITFSESLGAFELTRYWWAPLLSLALSAGFYALSMKAIEPALNWRREKLMNLMVEAKDK